MAEVKIITENRLRYLAGEKGFNLIYLEKDFFLTAFLYLIREIDGICLKGGTALNKIFLRHARLSEDVDFSCTVETGRVKGHILDAISSNKHLFTGMEMDRESKEFFRMRVFYRSYFTQRAYILVDVNKKASVILRPKRKKLPHFYDEIPNFEVATLDLRELSAEKIRALVMRNQPRDYFDCYMMLKNGMKFDMKMVERKLSEAGASFDVERIFKNARRIYSNWNEDIGHLVNEPVEYVTVIKVLQKEFGYKVPK